MFEAGNKGTNVYSQKNTEVDVFSLAYKIFKEGQAKSRLSREGNSALSIDIQQAGAKLLRPRIQEFNVGNQAYVASILGVKDDIVFKEYNTKDRLSGTNRSPI